MDELIIKLYREKNKKVVLLTDEYHAPLLSCLKKNKQEYEHVRTFLGGFYIKIKAHDKMIRVSFLTGLFKQNSLLPNASQR
jgi:hypothetical protein